MWRLAVPLHYWLIVHPEKRKFDVYLPALLVVLFCLPLLSESFLNDMVAGKLDLLSRIGGFLGVLVGFFIAALAAVATFGKAEMDTPMPGEPPLRLEHTINSQTFFEDLTRRRFLSFLFGYLSFVTLVLYILSFIFELTNRYFLVSLSDDSRVAVFVIFWLVFSAGIANVLSNTLLGLYYLTDRIHRPNSELEWKPPQAPISEPKDEV